MFIIWWASFLFRNKQLCKVGLKIVSTRLRPQKTAEGARKLYNSPTIEMPEGNTIRIKRNSKKMRISNNEEEIKLASGVIRSLLHCLNSTLKQMARGCNSTFSKITNPSASKDIFISGPESFCSLIIVIRWRRRRSKDIVDTNTILKTSQGDLSLKDKGILVQ